MKNYQKEYLDAVRFMQIKDREINRLTAKCELYRQVKNWTIILSIITIALIILL